MGITIKSLADIEKEVSKCNFLSFKNILSVSCDLLLSLIGCMWNFSQHKHSDYKQMTSYVTHVVAFDHTVTKTNNN